MNKSKSQHYNFTHEALPVLFHNNSDQFFKYLEQDGIKFLSFYWKHLVANLGVDRLSSFEGTNYELHDLGNNIKAASINMPAPQEKGEVFGLVTVKFPKKFRIFNVGFTRVFSLELEGHDAAGNALTGIYELTPRARNVRLKDGNGTDMKTLFQMVKEILKIKSGGNNAA